MKPEEIDAMRADHIRSHFPSTPQVWNGVAKEVARSIREIDARAGLVTMPLVASDDAVAAAFIAWVKANEARKPNLFCIQDALNAGIAAASERN